MTTTLLIGSGKLAQRLAPLLLADGGQVVAVRRRDVDLPEGVSGIRADLAQKLPDPLPAADAVVVTLPPSDAGYRTMLRNVAEALPAAPARTVFVSSTGVFEAGPFDRAITEADVPAPVSDRSRGLRDGELAAEELFGAVIIRPSGIYGPGREFLLRQVRERAVVNHRRRTNRIHEVDLVRAIHRLLVMADPPALVHGVDAAPAPLGEVAAYIAAELGVDAPPDDPSAGPSGTLLDGSLLCTVLGDLRYPTYREGYAEMIHGPAPD